MNHKNNITSELTPLKSHFSDDERRENDSFLCNIGLVGENKTETGSDDGVMIRLSSEANTDSHRETMMQSKVEARLLMNFLGMKSSHFNRALQGRRIFGSKLAF